MFMPEWQKKVANDPDLVYSTKPFTVVVPRSAGALIFEHNKPVHTHLVGPVPKHIKKDDGYLSFDHDGLIWWLIGGSDGKRSEETDIYGVVGLYLDMDLSGALADIAAFGDADTEESKKKALNEYKDLQAQLVKRTQVAMKSAKELADFRVRRALRITHSNLMKQWETLRTEGKGVYSPSVAEAVGAHILKKELEEGNESLKRMHEMIVASMNSGAIVQHAQ